MERSDELNVLAYGIEALLKLPTPAGDARYAWERDRRDALDTMRELMAALRGGGEECCT